MMPTAQLRRLASNRLEFDTHALILAGVLVGVAIISALITNDPASTSTAVSPSVPSSVEDPSTGKVNTTGGGLWVLLEILFAIIVLAGVFVYEKAPDWIQRAARRAMIFFVLSLTGAVLAVVGWFWTAVPVLMLGYIFSQAMDHIGVYWVVNNALSITLAVITAIILARLLTPLAIAVGLVGLTVYDHYFANYRDWMYRMAAPAVRWKLPVVFVIPDTTHFEWSELVPSSEQGDDGVESRGSGLGTADIALPAGFVASIVATANSGGWPVAIAVLLGVAVAAFRLRWLMVQLEDGSGGAGLPSITTGALTGYVLAYVPVVLVGVGL